MYQERNICFRRHHYARIKAKRVRNNYWGRGYLGCRDWCQASLGIAVNTPKNCSCHMCCNLRGVEGRTRKERLSILDLKQY